MNPVLLGLDLHVEKFKVAQHYQIPFRLFVSDQDYELEFKCHKNSSSTKYKSFYFYKSFKAAKISNETVPI